MARWRFRRYTLGEGQALVGQRVRRRYNPQAPVFTVAAVNPDGTVLLNDDAGPRPEYTTDLQALADIFEHEDGSPCGFGRP